MSLRWAVILLCCESEAEGGSAPNSAGLDARLRNGWHSRPQGSWELA